MGPDCQSFVLDVYDEGVVGQTTPPGAREMQQRQWEITDSRETDSPDNTM